jgi:cytochrome c peroxidase
VTQQTLEQAGILKLDGRAWGLVLGKALFWDHQAGSDGNACASCHFHAGADTRLKNQINPGFNDITKGPNGDTTFGSERSDTGAVLPGKMPSGAQAGSNYLLTKDDMPLHRLQDETLRNSPIVTTTNDRISSQGAFDGTFTRVKLLGQQDKCKLDAGIFHAGPYAARQVEPRNTPTAHNAVFFHRNFWDGRANNLFNGVGVFGMRDINGDPNKRLIVLDQSHMPQLGYLQVENASLASQAVGPPTSALEMSCDGRSFPDVGRKLLFTIPLFQQKVDKTDSVLGPYVSPFGQGLKLQYLYSELIKKTFDPKYWAAPGRYRIENGQLVNDPKGHTQMEINFSMFWGLSIMLYESTLVSDQSEFDSLQAAGSLVMKPAFVPAGPTQGACTSPTNNVDELLLRGCTIFSRFNVGIPTGPTAVKGGNCFICHNAQGGGVGRPAQPLLAEGTTQAAEPFTLFLTVGDVNGNNDLRDQGFANIGLRPAFTDQVSGKTDPYGNPLSFGRQAWNYLKGDSNALVDPVLKRAIQSGTNLVGGATALQIVSAPAGGAGNISKLEVDGSAKAPILRNIALTPPYFSWGGYPSLRQLLKVYNRGLNRRDISTDPLAKNGTACTTGDNSGTGPDGNQAWPVSGSDCNTNTTGVIIPLGLSDCDANVGGIVGPNAACTAKGHTVATDDLTALERFLKSLTDHRVQCDVAPFDHPALRVTNGHTGSDANHDGKANDIAFTLPAVGAAGYAPASGFCIPNSGDLFAPGMQARSGGQLAP